MAASLPVHIGNEQITRKQYGILCQLREAHLAGQAPMVLPILNKRDENTLKLLQTRDWIINSWKLFNEPRYSITSRGLHVLSLAEGKRVYRTGHLPCATCGNAPRHVYPSGVRIATCLPCHNAYNHVHRSRHGNGYRADVPCPCGKPRAVSARGVVYGQCRECRNNTSAQSQKRRAQRIREGVTATPLCKRCHQNPVLVTDTAVYSGCTTCLTLAGHQSKKRAKARRMAEKMGLRK